MSTDDPVITPLASPITIGELTDVPAPLSPIAAQFHQEVANRIVHRFATTAQMVAWAAADGSLAYATNAGGVFLRSAGNWWMLALNRDWVTSPLGLIDRTTGVYGQDVNAVSAQITNLSLTFTADPTRYYRTSFTVPTYFANGANPMIRFGIVDAGATILAESRFTVPAVQSQPPVTIRVEEAGLSGSITRRAICNATAAGLVQLYFPGDARAELNSFMTVEDLGAV